MQVKILFTMVILAVIVMMSIVEAAPAKDMLVASESETALEHQLVSIFCGNDDASADGSETQGRKKGKRGGKGKGKGKKSTTTTEASADAEE